MTQLTLKSLLNYDEQSGLFKWIADGRGKNQKAGNIAGQKSDQGYRIITIGGVRYRAHRLAWLYVYGKWPDFTIDHINHDRFDNKIKNLRDVTQQENCKNVSMSSKNISGRVGVSFIKSSKRWLSSIKVNGLGIYLGRFDTFDEAVKAREQAEDKYNFHDNHGENNGSHGN